MYDFKHLLDFIHVIVIDNATFKAFASVFDDVHQLNLDYLGLGFIVKFFPAFSLLSGLHRKSPKFRS